MKKLLLVLCLALSVAAHAQKPHNIIIVTTDGFRWQDLFKGMDDTIAQQKRFNEGDSLGLIKKYGGATMQERREKIMPFFWNTIATKGQVYGNRLFGNNINTENPHWFSYPGYSEIFTGYVDERINSNDHPANPNTTVLGFFNAQPELKGKVFAFSAWEAFNRILNEKASGVPVTAAYDTLGFKNLTANERLLNKLHQQSYRPWAEECYDVFTHFNAMETLKNRKPRVLYIAYGETDEWSHAGKYKSYLNAANQLDKWLEEIWNFVQSDPQYKNNTTLFITSDHGRGDVVKEKWTSHGDKIEGASQIWMAVMGPNTPALGEVKTPAQYYQKQYAQTIANLMGYKFTAEHPVADPIKSTKAISQ